MKKLLILFIASFIVSFTASPQSNWFILFDDGVTYTPDQVEYFDAKGDGVTDDFPAIQAAINSTMNLTGTINFANGKTYLISQPLYPKSNTTWNLGTATIKMIGGDSTLLTADYQKGHNYCVVTNPNLFDVGQWVGICDDDNALSSGNLLRYGWTDSIIAIGNDTLYFAHTLNYADTAKVSLNARVGHVQSVIIADSIDGWTLNGGTIDDNGFFTNQIKIHPVCTYPDNNEQVAAGTGISIMGSTNISINNVSVVNGVTHNIVVASWQNEGTIHSEDIRFDNINLNKARMKNLWAKEVDTLTVNVCYADSAIREDAIVGYTNVAVMTVDSAFITKWGRHGLLFNGNSGGSCDSLNATNIFLSYPLSSTTSAITLKGTRAWVNGFTISNGSTNRNRIAASNQYGGTNNVNFLNGTLTSVNDTAIISIQGDVGRVNFNNVVLNNCTGVAVRIDTFATATPNTAYDGCPDTITFTNGGVYGHTGYNFKYTQPINTDSTKIIHSNFFTSSSIYGLTATARTGTNNFGVIDLAWSDSTNITNYVIYRGLTSTPTDSIAGTTAKSYTDSSLAPSDGIYYYRIRGRASDNATYTNYCTVASDTMFQPEIWTWIGAAPVSPSDAVRYNLNIMVKRLKDSLTTTEGATVDQLSDVYDLMYPASSDSASSKLNLVKRAHDGVVMDTLSFTALQGWTADVTGGLNYMHTNYTPSSDTVNFRRYSNGAGVYVRTNPSTNTTGSTELGGVNSGGKGIRLSVRTSTNAIYLRNMTSSNAGVSIVADSRGYWVLDRASNTGYELYKNGSALETVTAITVDPMSAVNTFIAIHGFNIGGTMFATGYSPKQLTFPLLRKSLSAAGNRAENNCIEAYMDALGTGVE